MTVVALCTVINKGYITDLREVKLTSVTGGQVTLVWPCVTHVTKQSKDCVTGQIFVCLQESSLVS